ncbi:hypothetical protein P691DRAFT_755706 [Macrolepiota fuliginosa MF-IS2]|uniref:Cytokinin riboside 5'-monophosphate phosphoribohydrolase n=1 Tax=Macrolepiota fuliginosa MF-IS2 TaxID=1400762 RepID=A0A9P5XLY0_9AGAR|nr:hypothetical protein P691DRAFT_755706 [Macrolepiota fuliginosa MF-IS2]
MAASANSTDNHLNGGVAVYCGSSTGEQKAYVTAAESLGKALARQNRPLVYGGGSKGIMGVVSGTVLEHGGKVTGIVPYAMVISGGEREKGDSEKTLRVDIKEKGREAVETFVVQSMHERKVEMARRSVGFVGLPGGFGTFEEVLEVTTWTQLGIHDKPVVLVNVLGFWDPLRQLIKRSIQEGFIKSTSEHLVTFVDGPANPEEHPTYDWGTATLAALDEWERGRHHALFDWTQKMDGTADRKDGQLIAT